MFLLQNDIRTISVSHWGSELGLQVLTGLSQLYTSLVWESTVLLALCSEDILPPGCQFGRADMDRIIPHDVKDAHAKDLAASAGSGEGNGGREEEGGPHSNGSNGMSAAMEGLSTSEPIDSPMEVSATMESPVVSSIATAVSCNNSSSAGVDSTTAAAGDRDSAPGTSSGAEKDSVATSSNSITDSATALANASSATGKKSKTSPILQAQIRQLRPLLSVSSRLGRSLAELFGLLVKLCVGSPVRQRRSQQQNNQTLPTPAAKAVAAALTRLLANGLSWEPPYYAPPKLRWVFMLIFCLYG